MIEIKNISKSFNSNLVIDDLSLDIDDGVIFGIVGYSGAGKSTLVRCINRLEQCDKGQILIDGQDILKLKPKDLNIKRQKISMIFQSFNLLWSRTVIENIELPMEIAHIDFKQRRKKSLELLEKVGLLDKKDFYPSELSGGQKQRVAIARALTLDPKILLCDEATSALDPKTSDEILTLLKTINKELKLTIILITHQMEAVQKICHKVAIMANGKIVEQGSVEKIFKNPSHHLTKQLIQTVDTGIDVNKINLELKAKYQTGHLIRLTFDTTNSNSPVLYTIAKKLDTEFSIVSANIKDTQTGILGVMYLHLKQKDIASFIDELNKNGVHVEVI